MLYYLIWDLSEKMASLRVKLWRITKRLEATGKLSKLSGSVVVFHDAKEAEGLYETIVSYAGAADNCTLIAGNVLRTKKGGIE